MEADRFFWFDPFGEAPEAAVVTGTAGAAIWWLAGGAYPDLRPRDEWQSWFERHISLGAAMRALKMPKEPPAGFQLWVGAPRDPERLAHLAYEPLYVGIDYSTKPDLTYHPKRNSTDG